MQVEEKTFILWGVGGGKMGERWRWVVRWVREWGACEQVLGSGGKVVEGISGRQEGVGR